VSHSEFVLEHSYYPKTKYLPYSIVGHGFGSRKDANNKNSEPPFSVTLLYLGAGWNLSERSALEFRFKLGTDSALEISFLLRFQ
jgi:hypothetical protein